MRLSKSNPGFVTLLKNLSHMPQAEIASAFNAIGVVSKTGLPVTASHISNLERAIGRRRVRPHEKPNYKGKNHYFFS